MPLRTTPRGLLPLLLLSLAACGGQERAESAADSAFAAVQSRGGMVMGVDQEASQHVFEDLPGGGRIIFTMADSSDSAGTATIRAHLRTIADSFAAGVFSDPAIVHAQEVPGTATMTRLKDRISYIFSERAGGGELRLVTGDAEARAAIKAFLAFQRGDHRAPGDESREHEH